MIFLISAEATKHFTDILGPVAVTNTMAKINMKEKWFIYLYTSEHSSLGEAKTRTWIQKLIKSPSNASYCLVLYGVYSPFCYVIQTSYWRGTLSKEINHSLGTCLIQMPKDQSSVEISDSQCV